jgi:hypothetical protein
MVVAVDDRMVPRFEQLRVRRRNAGQEADRDDEAE